MSAETLNRWGIEPVGAAARLRVAAALADADHEAASRAYADLAAASSGDESAGAMLRASLHAGLAGRAAAELDRIEAIPAGGVPSVERALVLGWLRAFTGDVIAARLAFLAAADAALASDDPTRALRALRNAERSKWSDIRWRPCGPKVSSGLPCSYPQRIRAASNGLSMFSRAPQLPVNLMFGERQLWALAGSSTSRGRFPPLGPGCAISCCYRSHGIACPGSH